MIDVGAAECFLIHRNFQLKFKENKLVAVNFAAKRFGMSILQRPLCHVQDKGHRYIYLEVMNSFMYCPLDFAFEHHPTMHAYIYTQLFDVTFFKNSDLSLIEGVL
jgi:hypothetical protein